MRYLAMPCGGGWVGGMRAVILSFYPELMPHYISDPLTLTLQKEWDEEEGGDELS